MLRALLLITLAAAGSIPASGATRPGWVISDLGVLGPAYTSSAAVGIDDRGQIAGTSGTASGVQRAFLWEHGKLRSLGTLGGSVSSATAINASGWITGTSLTARAPLAVPAVRSAGFARAPSASLTWNLGGETHAPRPARLHGFLWRNGRMLDLGTLGGRSSRPRALNDRGQVVGESQTSAGKTHAFLWQNGKMADLGTLGGPSSTALAINARGDLVGASETARGRTHAFLWRNGKMRDLGTLGRGYVESTAVAINDRGQIAGTSSRAPVTQTGRRGHAFLWRNGRMRDLGTLPGYRDSTAVGLNERGEVVGSSLASTGRRRPVVWKDGRIVDLGGLGGAYADAVAISGAGQVIGVSTPAVEGAVHAFVWQGGQIANLGTLGGAESDAAALNGRNQIVGVANTRNGRRHAVLWTLRHPLPVEKH